MPRSAQEHENFPFLFAYFEWYLYYLLEIGFFMKMRIYQLLLTVLISLGASCEKESIDNTTIDIPIAENNLAIENELLDVVNDYRVSLGFNVLEFSQEAYNQANLHSDYMISKGSLSHDNFSSRASKISAEVGAEFIAENVAKDYGTAAGAFEKWLSSSSHKKTMEGEFTHTAVSVKVDANGKLYFTQLFFR